MNEMNTVLFSPITAIGLSKVDRMLGIKTHEIFLLAGISSCRLQVNDSVLDDLSHQLILQFQLR